MTRPYQTADGMTAEIAEQAAGNRSGRNETEMVAAVISGARIDVDRLQMP